MPDPQRQLYRQIRRRVAELTPETTDPAEHERLRALLDEVPRPERYRSWRQASVLLDVRFRARPWAALRQLRILQETMTRNGRAEQFDAFHEEVRGLLGDFTITPHGYNRRLDSLDAPALWRRVADLGAELERRGFSWFVTSGTLLGLVREGGVVAHDDDVDLCVLLEADDETQAAEAWLAAREALVDLIRPQELHRVAKVDDPDGPTIDLFPAWCTGGRLYAWPWSYGEVAADDAVPLVEQDVAGARLLMPARPDVLLTCNYGEGWRTPDPLFTFDWPGARERFATFIGILEGEAGGAPGTDPDAGADGAPDTDPDA